MWPEQSELCDPTSSATAASTRAISSRMIALLMRVVSGAAVLFGHHDAEQPLLGELRDQLRRKPRVLVALGRAGRDLAVGELAHRLLQKLLFFGQLQIHVVFT